MKQILQSLIICGDLQKYCRITTHKNEFRKISWKFKNFLTLRQKEWMLLLNNRNFKLKRFL